MKQTYIVPLHDNTNYALGYTAVSPKYLKVVFHSISLLKPSEASCNRLSLVSH